MPPTNERLSRGRRNSRLLIPQGGEPAPFQRSDRRAMRSIQEAWIELGSDESPEFPPAEAAPSITRNNEVTVEFERSASSKAVTRPPGYWKMRDGKFIAITDMEMSHIENTILMLERASLSRGRRLDRNRPGSYKELLEERDRRVGNGSELSRIQEREREEDRISFQGRFRDLNAAQVRAAEARNAQGLRQAWLNQQTRNARRLFGQMTADPTPALPAPPADLPPGRYAILDGRYIPMSEETMILPHLAEHRVNEPVASPTAIEENRPKRRIKT